MATTADGNHITVENNVPASALNDHDKMLIDNDPIVIDYIIKSFDNRIVYGRSALTHKLTIHIFHSDRRIDIWNV